jgi:hypothetical protein
MLHDTLLSEDSSMDTQNTHIDTHPGLFKVKFESGDFNSSLIAERAFREGEIISSLGKFTPGPKAYSTVQWGPGRTDHIELNTDLLYLNHSCEPNVAIDVSDTNSQNWHVKALKDIAIGDTLTFFYPSTEWDMGQSFKCSCGARSCLGQIYGAKWLSREELSGRGFTNKHIWELLEQRDTFSK